MHAAGRSYIPQYERVRRRDHHGFVREAVERAGGRVLFSTPDNVAPLFLGVENPPGETIGVVVYAFMANSREIKNRPPDEHRLQIRYGDVNDPVWRLAHHPIAFDPTGVDVTLVLGVEIEADLIVALDPVLYSSLPMGISRYWKDREAERITEDGWYAWASDNFAGPQRDPRSAELGLETMIGFAPERLLDFIAFERRAQSIGLDPALRLKAAHEGPAPQPGGSALHALEVAYQLPAGEILEIIAERRRLGMAVRGGVAEHHLGSLLKRQPHVTHVERSDGEGPPDHIVTLDDGRVVRVECKNASPESYADGDHKVEVQKTRASKNDPASRFYETTAFDVLGACMFGPLNSWTFKFRRSEDLLPHKDWPGRIAPLQRIDAAWSDALAGVL